MRPPDEQLKPPGLALAVVSGAIGGLGGGLLLPAGLGLFRPAGALEGILCFGFLGLVAGCAAGSLCGLWWSGDKSIQGFECVVLSLLVGGFAGVLATLPL